MARLLSSWLGAYAEFTRNSEAPDIFNFWTGVSTVAGALRRQVWIDEVKFKWFPNFYIIFVAPAGVVTKSTTMSVGMGLLRQVDGVKMGPGSMTWQGLTWTLQESLQLIPFGADGLSDYMPMSAITCEVSELGTFLDPRDNVLSSVLIDLWDGKEVPWERWLRSNDNTRIENPWVNIIAATTPSWLKDNFSEIMIGGGLTSRIVFVFADKKKTLVPYVSRTTQISNHKELEDALISDLQKIAQIKGEYKLTNDAYDFGEQWYAEHWNSPEEHLLGSRFQGYRARKQSHIHKLAIILSASESDSRIITRDHMQIALHLVSGTEADMHKVFDNIGVAAGSKHIETILDILQSFGNTSRQELWRMAMKTMNGKEFGEALDGAIMAGYIAQFITADGPSIHFIRSHGDRGRPPKPNGSGAYASRPEPAGTEESPIDSVPEEVLPSSVEPRTARQ